jgi:hypothetical protein
MRLMNYEIQEEVLIIPYNEIEGEYKIGETK